MPAATQASTSGRNNGLPPPPPQELLTMFGRRSGRGFPPRRSVGARIHWPAASSAVKEQEVDSQPLAEIQRASGATPIWFGSPAPPIMVPMVCVPWPTLSHGTDAGLVQMSDGSYQLYSWSNPPSWLPRDWRTSAGW